METFSGSLVRNLAPRRYVSRIWAVLLVFAIGTGCSRGPIPSPPAPPALSCAVRPTEVIEGEPITAIADVSNFDPRHPLTYKWSSGAGSVSGQNNTATIDTTGVAGGSYSVTAHISDPQANENREATCTASFTVKEAPRNPPSMSVSANPTSVRNGEQVTLNASCTSPDNTPVTIVWTSNAGRISGVGTTAVLDTAGVGAGTITVSAECADSRGLAASASTQVAVEFPPPPPPQPIVDTGRDFLLSGDNEKSGYGMYSYLLWWNAPTPAGRSRLINIISAFLLIPKIGIEEGAEKVMSSSGELTKPAETTPRPKLNVAYIPLTANPGQVPSADWILDHYDIARARILLGKLPREYRSGPYIVSTLTPLSLGLAASAHYLFQDLSAPVVSADLADAWIRQFQEQAEAQEFWKPEKMRTFVLSLRAKVSELAIDIPQARDGVGTWIAWLSPPKH